MKVSKFIHPKKDVIAVLDAPTSITTFSKMIGCENPRLVNPGPMAIEGDTARVLAYDSNKVHYLVAFAYKGYAWVRADILRIL